MTSAFFTKMESFISLESMGISPMVRTVPAWPISPPGCGLGDWKMINPKAVDPNPDGGHKYGVGDATIAGRSTVNTSFLYLTANRKAVPTK